MVSSDLFVTLSVEAKIAIFQLALAGNPSLLQVLRAVCRDWRAVIDVDPTCNRGVDFSCVYWNGGVDDILSLRTTGKRVRFHLSRHPSLLLDLRVAVVLGPSGWNSSHFFFRTLMNEELYAMCSDASSRTRSIDVRGTGHVLEALFHWPWPLLEELKILVDEDPSVAIEHAYQPPVVLTAPVLSRIHSDYMTPAIISMFPRVARAAITYLDLFSTRMPPFAETPLAFFMQVATSFPHLQYLAIALDDIDVPLPIYSVPFGLPFLKSLVLSSSRPRADSGLQDEWINSTLWSHFVAPALQELTVPQ
ncbi:hypothetical protein K438DRAFT_1766527 [Mycena galopus ATCC 62051]|nr:hypothetical protein K438DRAFT_1766527 [Mycena galopus ATCC 62051]